MAPKGSHFCHLACHLVDVRTKETYFDPTSLKWQKLHHIIFSCSFFQKTLNKFNETKTKRPFKGLIFFNEQSHVGTTILKSLPKIKVPN